MPDHLLPDHTLPDDRRPERPWIGDLLSGAGRAGGRSAGDDPSPAGRRRTGGPGSSGLAPELHRTVAGLRLARAAPSSARWSWTLAVVLVVAGVALTLDAQRDAAAVRRAFGRTATAWVAARDVEAGTALAPDDVRRRDLPAALLPASALAVGDDPAGLTTLTPLAAGEVLLRHHLAGDPEAGPAAMLPAGTLGLTLPAGTDRPALAVGQAVVLVLTGDPDPGRSTGSGLVAGVVAAAGGPDGTVVVAVAAADAVRVAAAVRQGTVVVALPAPSGSGPLRPRTGSTG